MTPFYSVLCNISINVSLSIYYYIFQETALFSVEFWLSVSFVVCKRLGNNFEVSSCWVYYRLSLCRHESGFAAHICPSDVALTTSLCAGYPFSFLISEYLDGYASTTPCPAHKSFVSVYVGTHPLFFFFSW